MSVEVCLRTTIECARCEATQWFHLNTNVGDPKQVTRDHAARDHKWATIRDPNTGRHCDLCAECAAAHGEFWNGGAKTNGTN
jgi:hypothetical protein